jgi:hypothetical protein
MARKAERSRAVKLTFFGSSTDVEVDGPRIRR